jgi:hypothetical protein
VIGIDQRPSIPAKARPAQLKPSRSTHGTLKSDFEVIRAAAKNVYFERGPPYTYGHVVKVNG